MEYAEKKVLISQKDFDKLLNQGSFKRDAILDAPKVTSIKLKQLNDNFLKERTLKKNQKDLQWSKLASRIEPILSPLYRPAPPTAPPPALSIEDNDQDDEMEIVDFLDDNLTASIRNKGQRLYQVLLDHPEEIRVTKKRIYVNGQSLPGNTLAIMKNLIAKSKNLSYNVKRLLNVIALDLNVKTLIGNEEALNYISQSEGPVYTSSPKGSPNKRKKGKSPAKSPAKSKKSSPKKKKKQESKASKKEETDDSSSMSEDLDDTIVEVKQEEKQGSGKAKKRGLKWLRMF